MRIAVVYDHAADDLPGPSTAPGAGTVPERRDVVRSGLVTRSAPDITGVREAVDAVVEALVRNGHAAFPVAACPPFDRLLSRLSAVDLVFNLAEGLGGRAEDESRVAALLELSGRPVTGAPSEVLALCRRKDRVNAILGAGGLPVPDWTVAGPGGALHWSSFPAIVKPAGEDGSVGIHETSVVDDRVELRAALERAGGDSLVQAFVPGREFNVGLVGREVLPVAEIVFAGAQRVVSYAAKWTAGSEDDLATRPVCPARIGLDLHGRLVAVAREAWERVEGRGYGRVDLRVDPEGRPQILEVNPNPDLAPSAGLARMARARGWPYDDLVLRIVEAAL